VTKLTPSLTTNWAALAASFLRLIEPRTPAPNTKGCLPLEGFHPDLPPPKRGLFLLARPSVARRPTLWCGCSEAAVPCTRVHTRRAPPVRVAIPNRGLAGRDRRDSLVVSIDAKKRHVPRSLAEAHQVYVWLGSKSLRSLPREWRRVRLDSGRERRRRDMEGCRGRGEVA
jgi:hypothetical protein